MPKTRETNEAGASKERAPTRVPLGQRAKYLEVSSLTIPGYHLHWVNDTKTRIHDLMVRGYEFVKPDEINMTADLRTSKRDETNESVVIKPVGSAVNSYLMKIKQEWYDEDQATKQAEVDEIEEDIRSGEGKAGFENSYTRPEHSISK